MVETYAIFGKKWTPMITVRVWAGYEEGLEKNYSASETEYLVMPRYGQIQKCDPSRRNTSST